MNKQWYVMWGYLFLTMMFISSMMLVLAASMNWVVEAWACAWLLIVDGLAFLYACRRINQLSKRERSD